MARFLLAGSQLNAIAGSSLRYPAWQVLIWNPHRVTLNEIASGTVSVPPIDITSFVESISYSENIGFENGDDPSVPQASFRFHRATAPGLAFRRGLIEDGVLVQIRQGDARVAKSDWMPIFTGTFRGRPGDDAGTPADKSEGLTANAYGREERFLNLQVTTKVYEKDVDLGTMANGIALDHMGLGVDEVLFGALGVISKHVSNQIVESPALQAIWQCLFPAGKKPKFDALGRLVAVDVDLDKPAARIYSAGNVLVRSRRAAPNDVEVNNSVVLRGLAHELTKIVQMEQMLTEFMATTGFFDSEFEERIFFSQDHTGRAQNTRLVTRKKIKWSDAEWTQVDEFHGVVDIDTRHLRNARIIIFVIWLVVQILIAVIDLIFQGGSGAIDILNIITFGIVGGTLATIRFALQLLSLAALAALLWSMTFIGRGKYEVWGEPFEYVYQELMAQHQLVDQLPEEIRELEFRNDFISTMEALDARAKELLRRELVKDQLYTIEVLDDPVLEVDDVIETAEGDRYYIVTVEKVLQRGAAPVMSLTCWKILDGEISSTVDAAEAATV